MASSLKRTALSPVRLALPDRVGVAVARMFSGRLRDQITAVVTGQFVELLLHGMDLAFCLSRGYHKHIEQFQGTYLFRTTDDEIVHTAIFANGNMQVSDESVADWDVRVTFRDAEVLKTFLLSPDRDVVDAVLKNDVAVDGNLNYIYKFGFMAMDLAKRLGVLRFVQGSGS
jgi:hypothetical protein